MTDPSLVRRLTTIVDIDVVGFSAMSARDEEHALELLGRRMAIAQALVKHHRGRVFKLTGDGLLAEFASPVEAVRAALEIQEAMRSANASAEPDDQLVLRIGINLGDVVESGDDLMGDAVNVAARLESIARPGGICVSAAVYEQIEGKLTLGAVDMGEQHVKNIPRAIHAYQLTLQGARPVPRAAASPATGKASPRLIIGVGAAAAIVAFLSLGGAWLLHERSEATPPRAQVAAASTLGPPAASPPPSPLPPPAPPATAPPSVPVPPAAANPAPAPPGPASPLATPRRYSATDVPFVADWRRGQLEHYARAEDAKALAINVRGWFALATRRSDTQAARHAALEECNRIVEREVPTVRNFDHCMIYAVGDEVVWAYRPPPMPPPPYVPATRPSPPIAVDPATVPLIGQAARRNVADHYLRSERNRAMVLGRRHFDWWSPSDSESDAIRRNLQICGHITGYPCVVYAVAGQVMVRTPQLYRVVDVFAAEDLANLDAGQKASVERYLVADDWRAIAVAPNGRLGIVTGRASEDAAANDAVSECTKTGGTECAVTAVGPFLVAPK